VIVHTFICPYRLANSYLIEIESGKFIGVDIGNIDITEVTSIIESNKGKLLGYFLTHAHGDHTFGIKKMWDLYKMPIYCSKHTSIDINDSRRNFSAYSDGIQCFEYDLPFNVLADSDTVFFENHIFKVILTPGHSPGCMVVIFQDTVFTGDFIMKDFKTPLNLPNSSRLDYVDSKEKFYTKFKNFSCTYYPGHGDKFQCLNDIY
jgi:hydroxyacylglutathione hydrolase